LLESLHEGEATIANAFLLLSRVDLATEAVLATRIFDASLDDVASDEWDGALLVRIDSLCRLSERIR
jgi:hypothetical protein